MDETEVLLKELTQACGAPGYERDVRAALRQHLTLVGNTSTDRAGNLICRLNLGTERPRVALVAHMDEIGFVVRYITEDGFIRFASLGGWLDQAMIGHRVLVQTRRGIVPGVIGGMKPPHVYSLGSRDLSVMVPRSEMYIDIGATSQAEAEAAGVQPGDGIVPKAEFERLAVPGAYMAKALDDRVGCALMVQAMQTLAAEAGPPNALYAVGTVMEEVGLRGVLAALHAVEPDVAIVLEADVAGDVPNMTADDTPVRLGKGPSVLLYDPFLIPNHRFMDVVRKAAADSGVPLQMQSLQGGATDGAAIHLHRAGVPTIVLGVPSRHMHTPGMVWLRRDYDWALRLVTELIRRLDDRTTAELGEY